MEDKTYIFYFRTLLSDGEVLKIKAPDIRKALKSLDDFFFNSGLDPKQTYLSLNYQLYSKGKFYRRKLNDRHYRYLSSWINKLIDIHSYGRIPE